MDRGRDATGVFGYRASRFLDLFGRIGPAVRIETGAIDDRTLSPQLEVLSGEASASDADLRRLTGGGRTAEA